MSHREKISKKRLNVSTGTELGKFLLDQYKQQNPEAAADKYKWNMFAEIIMRIAIDVAGNHYALAEDRSQFSAFDRIFEALKKENDITGKDPTGIESFHRVLDALPAFTKGIVQTPHPTEVLTRDAIDAERALHTLLENSRNEIIAPIPGEEIGAHTFDDLIKAADTLYKKMLPLREALTPEKEMARSVEFSEVMFDSLPITMQTILEGAARHGMYDGRRLEFDELTHFNFLLQPETWSPGDRDSKEAMTAQMLKDGVELNERSIRLHYMKYLAEMLIDIKHRPELDSESPGGAEKVSDILKNTMYRLMCDMSPTRVIEYIDEHLTNHPEIAAVFQETLKEWREDNGRTTVVENKHANEEHPDWKGDEKHDMAKTAFADAHELVSRLTYLRSIPGVQFEQYRFADGREAYFDKLDALFNQVNNFGLRALRSQIRENAERHEEVMPMGTLANAGLLVAAWEDSKDPATAIHNAMKPEVLDAALELAMSPKGDDVQKHIHIELERIGHESGKKTDAEGKLTPEGKFYETFKGFELAASKPEAITRYLIAECRQKEDMLAAFLLLKTMEPNETRHDTAARKVEIVPLFEHRDHVNASPGAVISAYKNKHFREHHNALTDPNDPAITKLQPLSTAEPRSVRLPDGRFPESQKAEHITVAEAKERYGLPVKPDDENKQVHAMKLVMYAGSDITKSAGAGGAGLVMHTTNVMREQLLDMDEPVLLIDYTGVGGGAHRSQPVATAFETAQGRSLRQTPQSVAQKTLMQAGRAVRAVLDLELPPIHFTENGISDDKKAVLTAQLNMGNIAALKWREDLWEKPDEMLTGKRLNASMDMYQELYKDPAYSAYLGYTADPFVKLTSYAARGAARGRSKGDAGGFPPLVDVDNLRAIGYGAALNASGSCAGLYYGASKFLNTDDKGNLGEENLAQLKHLYLQDPIAQDRINRATYGVVMADMGAAWKYLGYKREEDANGNITLSKGSQRINRDDLLNDSPALQSAVAKVAAARAGNGSPPSREEKELVASHVLAKIDKEYQVVSKGLLQLHRAVKHDVGLKKAPNKGCVADQLLNELPEALKAQLHPSRHHMWEARQFLAEKFHNIVEGKEKLSERKEDNFKDIYFAMGSIFETFENIPRAYTRMRWALENEHLNKSPEQVAAR